MMATETNNIRPLEVASYLKSTGWTAIKSRRPNIEIYNFEKEGIAREVTLPTNQSFKDYQSAINIVIERIAEVEHRVASDVLSSLATTSADVVKFRLTDSNTEYGTIPFDDGIKLFENARKALYVTACDLLEPKLYHKKLRLKAADAFIERCSFGQTERGSYVATIVCPFSQADEEASRSQLSLFEVEPDYSKSFTRQVTIRLMRSLSFVHQAIENNQIDKIQQTDSVGDIISGNLLEALLDLNGSTSTSEVEISTQWALLAPVLRKDIPASVHFKPKDFQPISVAVERIQKLNEHKSREGVFIGRISLIQAEPNIEQRTNGEVVLNTIDTNGKLIKPRMVVSPQELDMVMKAMKEGSNVKVRGMLTFTGKSRRLEYTSFELID